MVCLNYLLFSLLNLYSFNEAFGLECQRCSSDQFDSACRKGTDETRKTCDPSEGDDVCYMEIIFDDDSGNPPLYRRGCASNDWCTIQDDNHGKNLKMCKTCQEDNCNNENFSAVEELECQYCDDREYNSPCRLGTSEGKKTCNLQMGDLACYEEYIILNKNTPMYRRGCSTTDWCAIQVDNHGYDLKDCNTCQGNHCNNDRFGSPDGSTFMCRYCESRKLYSDCAYGNVNETTVCGPNEKYCVASVINHSNYDKSYARGCGTANYCYDLEARHNVAVGRCTECKQELCNNEKLPIDTSFYDGLVR